jgi:hypothetical protein
VPIEKIEVGDRVFSRNRQTGKTELRPVTALTPPHRDRLLELRIEGERTPLRPSTSHPFWAKRRAADPGHWIEAANLVAGELLETIDGRWVAIQSVAPVDKPETVYNFTVEEDHDYFVGDEGLLVHNFSPAPILNLPWITPGSLPPGEEQSLLGTLGNMDNGTVPTGPTGIKWGTPFENRKGHLPGGRFFNSPYQEYRVHPAPGTPGPGARRLVQNGTTGETYYTWTHYGQAGCPPFVRIR